MQQISGKIYDLFGRDFIINPITLGQSGSKVFFLQNKNINGDNFYLKINNQNVLFNLQEEYVKLKWLENKLQVPKALSYFEKSGFEYLLVSALPGKSPITFSTKSDRKNAVKLIAQELKNIHSIKISECPFNNNLENQLLKIKEIIKLKLVNQENFGEENKSKSVEELFKEVIRLKPSFEDLVFTHGDFCLPNIIIDNQNNIGFVDLGRSGIADRYKDIALCVRSILHNFNDSEIVEVFLSEYGLDRIDNEKIKYFQLLDEFF